MFDNFFKAMNLCFDMRAGIIMMSMLWLGSTQEDVYEEGRSIIVLFTLGLLYIPGYIALDFILIVTFPYVKSQNKFLNTLKFAII